MNKKVKENKNFVKNHFFPKFYLNYWKKSGATLYNKRINEDRSFNPFNIFDLARRKDESIINIKKIFFDDENQFIHRQSKGYVCFLKRKSDIFRYISVSF